MLPAGKYISRFPKLVQSLYKKISFFEWGIVGLLKNFFKNQKFFLHYIGGKRIIPSCADMAQLVEHHLAKVGVAGSNPVVRSMNSKGRLKADPFCLPRHAAGFALRSRAP